MGGRALERLPCAAPARAGIDSISIEGARARLAGRHRHSPLTGGAAQTAPRHARTPRARRLPLHPARTSGRGQERSESNARARLNDRRKPLRRRRRPKTAAPLQTAPPRGSKSPARASHGAGEGCRQACQASPGDEDRREARFRAVAKRSSRHPTSVSPPVEHASRFPGSRRRRSVADGTVGGRGPRGRGPEGTPTIAARYDEVGLRTCCATLSF